ncbi:hypothetical protein [Faecalibacterium prausnitzii]|uniref:hypothetical protein n=1 Tax=Faecalibacterium prausnitzii TaxID=853 RepID=UPI001FA78FD6|nr:hypothetical protein [Faecalibacterium prausnitzii]MCI3182929.1 hypothetical protein [Faecalibacterium prausnitzii]MCI3200388.1 hypothetical protein [Faecalibacterium prausnitzii]
MNLYEIRVVDGKGITHKSKVYEINVDAAFKEAFIQGKIYGAAKLDDCTIQQIQTNAGVSKDTEREYLGRIKNILDALGPNSYCAMAFEGCVEDAEENIDNDFAVSMKGRWESEKKAHEETREGLIGKLNDRIKRVAELEAEVQKARQMEAQARKEAAEDKIALEKAKEKILPDNVAAELTIMLRKQADEAAKEALYYADRMAAEVENSVPVGASNSAKNFHKYRKAQVDALRLLGALGNIGGSENDD